MAHPVGPDQGISEDMRGVVAADKKFDPAQATPEDDAIFEPIT